VANLYCAVHINQEETYVTGAAKANFSHLYDRPDPREYVRSLSKLEYEIPQRARPVFETIFTAMRAAGAVGDEPLRVLDLCCSYGVNAALLCHDLQLEDLVDRYTSPELQDLTADELCAADKEFFADRLVPDAARVRGLDVAANAVAYACRAGLLVNGWAENLETDPASADLAADLDHVDVVICTGGIGYITERTLSQVVRPRPGRPAPWLAAFVLRQYSYEPISSALSQHGIVTEQLHGTSFPQRLFASVSERESVLRAVTDRGLDPSGYEDSGRYYADFYLSRPSSDGGIPVNSLLTPVLP